MMVRANQKLPPEDDSGRARRQSTEDLRAIHHASLCQTVDSTTEGTTRASYGSSTASAVTSTAKGVREMKNLAA